jgi:hypothetical protein
MRTTTNKQGDQIKHCHKCGCMWVLRAGRWTYIGGQYKEHGEVKKRVLIKYPCKCDPSTGDDEFIF